MKYTRLTHVATGCGRLTPATYRKDTAAGRRNRSVMAHALIACRAHYRAHTDEWYRATHLRPDSRLISQQLTPFAHGLGVSLCVATLAPIA